MAGEGCRAGLSGCDGLGSMGLAGSCIASGLVAALLQGCFVALGAPQSLSQCFPPWCNFLPLLPMSLLLDL